MLIILIANTNAHYIVQRSLFLNRKFHEISKSLKSRHFLSKASLHVRNLFEKMFAIVSSVLLLAVLKTEVLSFSNFNFLLNGVNGNSVSVNARGESSSLRMVTNATISK